MGAACDEPPPPTPAPTAWASATPPLVVANASASSTLSDEDGAANLFDGDADPGTRDCTWTEAFGELLVRCTS